jgi:hypothetical protein
MSLEQTAYIARASVPERDALQAAIDSLGFDCKLDTSYAPFHSSGCLPCLLNGQESGVEIDFYSTSVLLKSFPHLAGAVGSRDVAITFCWGGNFSECACALIISAALAKYFGAIVHYQENNTLSSADQLIEAVRTVLKHV